MNAVEQSLLDEELALEEEVALERARTSFEGFVRYLNPGHHISWHHKLICDELERLVRGDNKRLIVTCPPRVGKSELISRHFPAFLMGINPDESIIATSYATPLAQRMSRDVQRIMDSPEYSRVFPDSRLWGKNVRSVAHGTFLRNSDIFEVVNHKGVYRAAGLGAGVTGMGGHCFVGETMVSTELGPLRIDHIVNQNLRLRVLSYDALQSKYVYKRITAVSRRKNTSLCEVRTARGRVLTCTPEHLLFTQDHGYRQAKDTCGDRLLCAPQNLPCKKSGMPQMWQKSWPRRILLPKVLHFSATKCGRGGLSRLQSTEKTHFQRLCESSKAARANPLQQELHDDHADETQAAYLRSLRKKPCSAASKILQRSLSRFHGSKTQNSSASPPMFGLREMDALYKSGDQILRGSLQKQSTQPSDVRKVQPLVCRREAYLPHSLQQSFSSDAASDKTQRPPHLLLLRESKNREAGPYPSHRRKQRKQSAEQSDYVVCVLPHKRPQASDSQGAHTDDRSQTAHYVYDIQVEGTNCYFANEILVHNCLIIDDNIKDAATAMSQTILDNQWEWYSSTFRTRLAKGGRIAIVATRWSFDDIIGRLLRLADEHPNADQWRVVNLPAIKELPPNEDDPRKPGEVLWPEFFPLSEMETLRATNSRQFEALYQCNPVPLGGNLIQDSWWRQFQQAELPLRFDKIIVACDLTFKDTQQGDWTVLVAMGLSQGRCYVLDMTRRQIAFTAQKAAILDLVERTNANFGHVLEVIVEDAANGAAIVDTLRVSLPNVIAVPARGASKYARASAVTPIIEAGNVLLPCPTRAAWVQTMRVEWAQFPMARHDDIVDAMTHGLTRLFPPRMSMLGAMPMGVPKTAVGPMFT